MEEAKKSFWDRYTKFDRFPKLEIKEKGDSAIFTFEEEIPTEVPAEVLAPIYKSRGLKIKPRDSVVFIVNYKGDKKEIWLGSQHYTNLREIASIREANNGNLKGSKAKVTRIAVSSPNEPNLKFEKA